MYFFHRFCEQKPFLELQPSGLPVHHLIVPTFFSCRRSQHSVILSIFSRCPFLFMVLTIYCLTSTPTGSVPFRRVSTPPYVLYSFLIPQFRTTDACHTLPDHVSHSKVLCLEVMDPGSPPLGSLTVMFGCTAWFFFVSYSSFSNRDRWTT